MMQKMPDAPQRSQPGPRTRVRRLLALAVIALSLALCIGLFFWLRGVPAPPRVLLKDASIYLRADTPLTTDSSWSHALESVTTPTERVERKPGQVLVVASVPSHDKPCAAISLVPLAGNSGGFVDIILSADAGARSGNDDCKLGFLIFSRPVRANASGATPTPIPVLIARQDSLVLRTRMEQPVTLFDRAEIAGIAGHLAADGTPITQSREAFSDEYLRLASRDLTLHKLILEPGPPDLQMRALLLSSPLSDARLGSSDLRFDRAIHLGVDAWFALIVWLISSFAAALAAWVWP
jgi:hypothetical protein